MKSSQFDKMYLKSNYFLFHALIKSDVERKKSKHFILKMDKMEDINNMLKRGKEMEKDIKSKIL